MKRTFLTLLIIFCGIAPIWSDQRDGNLDLFLVLDKSLSMEEEIEDVKDYVEDFLITKLLIPGDRIVIISFYGETELLYQGTWRGFEENTDLMQALESLKADGPFTDIGNALDRLKNTIPAFPVTENRRRYFLLLTDGKQEAPENSIYYSPDGKFNHQFLENVKVLKDEEWKVIVLGIGTDNAAKELADTLSGGYSTFQEAQTQAESETAEEDFLGIFTLNSKGVLKYNSKISQLELEVTGTGFLEPKVIHIKKATLIDQENREFVLCEDYETQPLSPEKQYTIKIPGAGLEIPEKGNYRISLSYFGQHQIVPAQFEIEVLQTENIIISKNGSKSDGATTMVSSDESGSNLLIIGIAAGILLLLFIIITLIRNHIPDDEDKKTKKKGLME